jgi:SAM-dependent methyltransferase
LSQGFAVDYDATNIPAGYDKARSLGPELLELWMTTLAAHAHGRTIASILDLGCGTGRFCEALVARFNADVLGVDPSAKMLEQARAKLTNPKVRYATGTGEAIPLPSQTIDMIFMSMVFHHFLAPQQVARECRRVLQHQGLVFLRTATIERAASYPYVGFFPGSRPILQERLPRGAFIREVFETAGFRTIEVGIVTQQTAPSYSIYAERLAAGGDSILAELDRQDFRRGLDAVRAHASRVDPQPVSEPIDFLVFE